MVEYNRRVDLLWKYNKSAFSKLNDKVLDESFRLVGSSVSGVNKIISNGEMIRMLMPEILGISPDTRDINWDAKVKDYWDSLRVVVPGGGLRMETGFNFDINDYRRQKYITKLIENNPKANIKTDEDLANFVMGEKNDIPNVDELEKFKYGHPIDTFHYLLWIYCLNYRDVANTASDANKSNNIRFFLHTQAEEDKIKKSQLKLKKDALTKAMDFLNKASKDEIDDLLALITPDSIRDIVKNKDAENKQGTILTEASANCSKFIETVDDKNLKHKAIINRFEAFGVIKKLPGTTVYVESADPSVTIGNNMNEAITFITNEKNANKVNELTAKYKSIINK
ncbi:hypothetical protein DSECCO2_120180 [anaerobic digester metagenome]